MGKKKKFIDKKKSATFQLLARDSSDPNYDAGPSGDRVFVRVDNNQLSVNGLFDDDQQEAVSVHESYSVYGDAPNDYDFEGGYGFSSIGGAQATPLPDHIRREILELGLPDDGYNYLTHLRDIKNTGGGSMFYHNPKAKLDQLPHDVKAYDASKVEISRASDDSNQKAMYNVAARTVGVRLQKAVDPEVAALLDDSDVSRLGSDVEDLEEDFVIKANLPDGSIDSELQKKLSLVEESEIFGSAEEVGDSFGMDHEKPRMRRLLDDQFDLLERQEYGTDSEDEYNGYVAEEDECQELRAERLNNAFKDHALGGSEQDDKYKVPLDLVHDKKGEEDFEDSPADVIHRCMEYAKKYEHESEGEQMVVLEESSSESEAWDCETIISTYSNLDNHPGKIGAPEVRRKKKLAEAVYGALSATNHVISLKGKEKLPVEFLPSRRKHTAEREKDVGKLMTEQYKRKQHGQESKEEKKERKAAVKEERREARRVKKEMKGLYRCEAQRAQKVAAFTGPSSIHLM